MPRNVQTTAQLHSSHTLAEWCSKCWSQASTVHELWISRCSSWTCIRPRNQRSNCQHPLDQQRSMRVPEKHLLLLYWLCQSLWLCRSQHTWKILKEMGIPDYLTCLLRNLCTGQEVTVRTGHGTTDWFKIWDEYIKAAYCHPAHLTYMQSI